MTEEESEAQRDYQSFPVATQNVTKFGAKPSVVAHICNPSTWEVEAGGSRVPG
jgi:hypothetical protein